MSWFVYILRCRTGELYTGCTNDLVRRVAAHDGGVASKFTRSRLPVTLVYQERCVNRSSALKRELRIKRMTHKQKVRLVELGKEPTG